MTLKILLPLSLAFIMFSMGLALVLEDFKETIERGEKITSFTNQFHLFQRLQVILQHAHFFIHFIG